MHRGHRFRLPVGAGVGGGVSIRGGVINLGGGSGSGAFGFLTAGGVSATGAFPVAAPRMSRGGASCSTAGDGCGGGSLRSTRRRACSSSLCLNPASQRLLLSASETSSFGFVLGCDSGAIFSGSSNGTTIRLGGVLGREVLVRIATVSVAPLRCAHSIALRPRLSRRCGLAPACISSFMSFVWPKMTARMRAV